MEFSGWSEKSGGCESENRECVFSAGAGENGEPIFILFLLFMEKLQVSPWKIANIICEYKNCEAFRKKFLT
jgi:hypothetical protein